MIGSGFFSSGNVMPQRATAVERHLAGCTQAIRCLEVLLQIVLGEHLLGDLFGELSQPCTRAGWAPAKP